MPSRDELLADHFLKATGIAAAYADAIVANGVGRIAACFDHQTDADYYRFTDSRTRSRDRRQASVPELTRSADIKPNARVSLLSSH